MIDAILKIVAALLPWVLDVFLNPERKVKGENEAFDKALANSDSDTIARLLSQRYDGVRHKKRDNS